MVIYLQRGASDLLNGPADATATPSSLDSLISRLDEPVWCGLSKLLWERGC